MKPNREQELEAQVNKLEKDHCFVSTPDTMHAMIKSHILETLSLSKGLSTKERCFLLVGFEEHNR